MCMCEFCGGTRRATKFGIGMYFSLSVIMHLETRFWISLLIFLNLNFSATFSVILHFLEFFYISKSD